MNGGDLHDLLVFESPSFPPSLLKETYKEFIFLENFWDILYRL